MDDLPRRSGLKPGDRLRLRCPLPPADDDEEDDARVYHIGESWTVAVGLTAEPDDFMLLRDADGLVYGWWDDASIFDYFEKIDGSAAS